MKHFSLKGPELDFVFALESQQVRASGGRSECEESWWWWWSGRGGGGGRNNYKISFKKTNRYSNTFCKYPNRASHFGYQQKYRYLPRISPKFSLFWNLKWSPKQNKPKASLFLSIRALNSQYSSTTLVDKRRRGDRKVDQGDSTGEEGGGE